MKILGIESTCDETGAAVVENDVRILSDVVSSQVALHAKYRGVVPEIASRAHIENILPVVGEALKDAHIELKDIDAVAVAHRPGLIGSLLIGVTAAKTLAWSLGKPLIGVDHVHAHLYSVRLTDGQPSPEPPMPAVGLVCSGGHTALYQVNDFLNIEMIGTTLDDAVGEAYDKVAAILGLGYPGGPEIDRLAPKAILLRYVFPAAASIANPSIFPSAASKPPSSITSAVFRAASAKQICLPRSCATSPPPSRPPASTSSSKK